MDKRVASAIFITAVTTVFLSGVWIGSGISRSGSRPSPAAAVVPSTTGFSGEGVPRSEAEESPRTEEREREDPRLPEPGAVRSREDSVRRGIAAIEADCRAAGGWNKWQDNTAPFRADLKAKIDALPPLTVVASSGGLATLSISGGWRVPEMQNRPLEAKNFPLFECGACLFARYLYEPSMLDDFRRDRAVTAAARWLRNQGIDLILVPAPRMTEVYVDRFLDPHPADGVIAPHVRRALLEMLKDDVEVIDVFSLFRAVRDADDREFLYNTADNHWAPRGMRIAAKEVADRIARYKFGARARYGLPVFQTRLAPHPLIEVGTGMGLGWGALSPEQRSRAQSAHTATRLDVFMPDGKPMRDNPESPVMVIGNSYVMGFNEQLARELNLTICTHWSANQTTESFTDFLRDPGMLAHTRVVVWVTTERHLSKFEPLPTEIMKTLSPATSGSGNAGSAGPP